jgi:antitoxin ChpS
MHKTNLRKVGGSVMLAVPPAVLEMLNLKAGSSVGLAIDGQRLIVEPKARIRYSLEELLSPCESAASAHEDTEWTTSHAVGKELL